VIALRYAFLHDARRCTGCRTCAAACRNQHRLEPGLTLREVYAYREEPTDPRRHFLSVACHHCAEPECVRVCPTGAQFKRADGLVIQNHDQCLGCRLCMIACPYGSPRYSARERKVVKCDLCVDRLEAGREPACVEACHTRALRLIDLDTYTGDWVAPNVPGFPARAFTDPSIRFVVPKNAPTAR